VQRTRQAKRQAKAREVQQTARRTPEADHLPGRSRSNNVWLAFLCRLVLTCRLRDELQHASGVTGTMAETRVVGDRVVSRQFLAGSDCSPPLPKTAPRLWCCVWQHTQRFWSGVVTAQLAGFDQRPAPGQPPPKGSASSSNLPWGSPGETVTTFKRQRPSTIWHWTVAEASLHLRLHENKRHRCRRRAVS